MALLDCILATPDGAIFSGKARSIVVPAVDGELGILPRHAPLIGALGCGDQRLDGLLVRQISRQGNGLAAGRPQLGGRRLGPCQRGLGMDDQSIPLGGQRADHAPAHARGAGAGDEGHGARRGRRHQLDSRLGERFVRR